MLRAISIENSAKLHIRKIKSKRNLCNPRNQESINSKNNAMAYEINKYLINNDNSARFLLGFDNTNPLFVIGVNPSTADDKKPDATIRKILGYVLRNDYNGFLMLNLYPQRATFPQNLSKECFIDLHKQNLQNIKQVFATHSKATVLVAFGDTIMVRPYLKKCFADIIHTISKYNPKWKQIGSLTKNGNPRHPSRGSYQPLQEFDIHKYLE